MQGVPYIGKIVELQRVKEKKKVRKPYIKMEYLHTIICTNV